MRSSSNLAMKEYIAYKDQNRHILFLQYVNINAGFYLEGGGVGEGGGKLFLKHPYFSPPPPPPPQLSFFPYHQGSESDSASNEVSAFVQLPDTVVFDALAVLDGEGQRVLLTGASTDEESATEVAREQQPLLCFSSGNVTKIPAGERGRAQQ